MQTIEERFKKMNLHRAKKGKELSSQEYYKDITVQYKKRIVTLPKIRSPDMMNICEVIDECPDDISPVSMEDCLNNNLDEIHRDITEHDIKTNHDTMKMIIEIFSDGQYYDEKKLENKNEGVIQRDITTNEIKNNQYTLNKVMESCIDETTPAEMEECVND